MANNIIRVSKPERFTVLSHETLRDARLSFAARGLLAYLLSLPDNWEVRVSHLIEQSPAGRDAVYAMLKELTAFGYMRRIEKRDAAGRILGYDTVVMEQSENPPPAREKPAKPQRIYTEKPDTEKPDTARPDSVKPDTKNNLREETPTPTGEEPPIVRAPRATPAPSRFDITQPALEWSKKNCPGVDLRLETANFLDHHRAKGSLFKDWAAAWRTWMRNSIKFSSRAKSQAEMNRAGKELVL
jgi:hypothetical protein